MDQHTLGMKWCLIIKILKWYFVLRGLFCLWYIFFVFFCGILRHGVLWSSPIHYLLLFANKYRIVLVSCNLKANSNAHPKILISSRECCSRKLLLLWNCWFWLVLVSADVPMILACFYWYWNLGIDEISANFCFCCRCYDMLQCFKFN